MILEIKRDKLIMQTTTAIATIAGQPSDDGKTLTFPIQIQLKDKIVPLVDINVAFESKSGEYLGDISVTYYDAANSQPKTSPLAQFKVNPEQILLNNGIEKTNENEQVLLPELVSKGFSEAFSEIVIEPSEQLVLPSVAAKQKKNLTPNTQEI